MDSPDKGIDVVEDLVVLVDDRGLPIGSLTKSEVHHADTPLHLAFSVFLFNSRGELLLQRRALSKKTWPGVWSNSCCGHPMPGEGNVEAARRRIEFELGITGVDLHLILPEFRYRAEMDGIVENEICPVFVGFTDDGPRPSAGEIAETRWAQWSEFLALARDPSNGISPWAVEEAELLAADAEFQILFAAKTSSQPVE